MEPPTGCMSQWYSLCGSVATAERERFQGVATAERERFQRVATAERERFQGVATAERTVSGG